ncbi:hypothetical protein ACT4S2_03270 [Kocuria turfanensis]|uniref:hypothetical protein n=1 Tax=Kocuria turfanensis TaxID=388357 RepID=UPI0040361410
MKRTYYITMTKRQAAAAFEEYLTERPPALEKLRAELAADGLDPDALLDGTPQSLTPLWRWGASRITVVEDEDVPWDPEAPPEPWWPSWARYSSDIRHGTPVEVVTLLDGFISYLGDVMAAGAPEATWQVCHHRVKRYWLQNHPVLASPLSDSNIYPPHMVALEANIMRRHGAPLREDRFSGWANRVITELRGENEPVPVVDEPLVEVRADGDDGVFDIGLHEEIAHEHSRKVNQLVKELATQPGILSAHREDREVLLVRAPDWDAAQLEQWVLNWLKARIPELD